MMKTITFLLLISGSLCAQMSGIVKDSLLGKPIPYVNIWVENESIGTTTELDGSFSLDIKQEKILVFSALGYAKKKISSKAETFLLSPMAYELNEILIINPKFSKTIEIGNAHKVHVSQLSGKKPWIYAKLFTNEDKFAETPFLKKIIFYTNSNIKEAKLKIRLFSVKDSLPSDDLIDEDLVVHVKKGMKKNVLDISKFKVLFPKDGVVIGLEWLIIEDNKYFFNYKDNKTGERISLENYAPSLIINYSNEEDAFTYYSGKWHKSRKHINSQSKELNGKVNSPAINLILSN